MSTDSQITTLRLRVAEILMSKAAQKIDFYLDNFHVDGPGLNYVALALISQQHEGRGISFRIGNLPYNAGAAYDPNQNFFRFPRSNYGLNQEERQTIVHESVHVLRDAYGQKLPNRAGKGRSVTRGVLDEAAAYIAECLYYLYDTPQTMNDVTPPWARDQGHVNTAFNIALHIWLKPGCNVRDESPVALNRLVELLNKAYLYNIPWSYDASGIRL